MPVLDLVAAAVLLLLTILLDLRYRISPLYLLPRGLSLMGALLLCVNVEPRTYLPQSGPNPGAGGEGGVLSLCSQSSGKSIWAYVLLLDKNYRPVGYTILTN